MNIAQAKHIFWKEYRYQRSIWLGIMLIILVLQALVYAMMPQSAKNPFETLIGVGSILTTFYALASAGVLFAGEREEETDGWLMTLPISKTSLFGGKLFWLLSSWLVALEVTSFTGYAPYWGANLVPQELWKFFLSMLRYGGSMVAWALLFSLLCKRVYTAIACATVAFVLSGAMIQYVAGVMDLLTITAVLGSVVVGRHWLSHDRVIALPQFAIWADKFNLERAIANSIERSPGWKMFRRQLWLEWRNARWAALGVFVASFAILLVNLFIDSSGEKNTHCMIVFAVIPLLVGACVWRGEQTRESYRFQSHVGVSPFAVWCSKHLVWGMLLSIMTLFFSLPLIAMASPQRDHSNLDYFRRKLFQMLPLPENSLPYLLQELYLSSAWRTMALWLAVLAFMYAVGQICSLLMKRSVSCLLVAMAFGMMLSYHLYATFFLNVPLPIAIGLPVAAMLFITAWRTRGWLEEKNDWQDWRRMILMALLMVLVCASSWMMWRMYEILYQPFHAGFMAFFPVTGLLTISETGFFLVLLVIFSLLVAYRRKLTTARLFMGCCLLHVACTVTCMSTVNARARPPLHRVIASLTPSDDALDTGNRYRDLELLIGEKIPSFIPEGQQPYEYWTAFWDGEEEITAEQQAWLSVNEQTLEKLIDNTQRPVCAPDNYFSVDDRGDQTYLQVYMLDRLHDLLRLKALSLEKDGRLAKAWDVHSALLRFYGHLTQHQNSYPRSLILDSAQRHRSHDMVRWMNHPDQTSELILHAAVQFSEQLQKFSTLEESFLLESTHRQWVVENDMLGLWGSGDNNINDWPVYLHQLLHSNYPMEKTRAVLLLQQIEQRNLGFARSISAGNSYAVNDEIASDTVQPWDRISPYSRNFSQLRSDASDEFWRLAAATPVVQATQTGHVEEIPYPIQRSSHSLFGELQWQRDQRLVFFSLAYRIAELDGLKSPDTLKGLVELSSESERLALILAEGEGIYGKKTNSYENLQPGQEWRLLLFYQEPVSRGLIQLDQVLAFLKH